MPSGYNSKTENILIVEDEAIAALVLSRFLNSIGFKNVDRVSTGRTAVKLAEEKGYDILFMDIGLPDDMDGIETARVILSRRRARLFFMTGYLDEDIRSRAMELRPDAYWFKPIDVGRIRQALLDGASPAS